MKNTKAGAYGLLVLTFFVWGSIYVASKYAMGSLPPVAIAGGRYAIAAIALLPFYLKSGQRVQKEDIKYLFLIGGVGYFASMTANALGIKLAGASTASLINSLNPVAISAMAAWILREKIQPKTIVCLGLSVAGALIITQGTVAGGELGILFSSVSVVLWAVASVIMRRLGSRYNAVTVTFLSALVSLIFYIPAGAVDIVSNRDWITLAPGAVAAVVYMGLFGTGLGGALWAKCLSMLEAGTCSLFYPLQVIFSAILGALFLQEQFTLAFFLGAVCICGSILIQCLPAQKLVGWWNKKVHNK